ncbi:hypothetical protein HA402_005917 [Bradysia odoriphaga]|nr:hypothetical protein HA402_005917 [Bradysia odoriphaga]
MADKQANEDRKKSKPQPLSKQTKILTTSAILFGNLTFVECADRNHFFDSTGGFISPYLNRQIVVIVGMITMVTSMYLTPYCPNKTMFFVSGGILGFSTGLYDSSQMVWMIEIWQNKAGPFIQAQHLFYAIGAVIPTVIVAPFLNKNVNVTDLSTTGTSTIHIPFLTIAAFGSLALLFQLFLFTFYRYHTPPMYANENFELIDDAKNVPSPIETELSGGSVSINQQQEIVTVMGVSVRKIKLVVITVVFLGAYQSMEVSSMQFLPIFGQYSDLKMTESASSYVLTGLNGMFAFGRLIGTIVIFKVRPELIIVFNIILVIMGNVILLIWANDSLTMFWLGSMILGLGFSTMFPSFCAFIEKYLVFTTSVASSTIVFGSLVSSIYPIIIGKFIEHRAVVLTYTNLLSVSVSGFISHYMNRQLLVIIALTTMTMSMYMAPYCPDKSMFFVSGGILGFSTGLYDSAQMVWMIEIWQHKAGPFIQAQSLFYGIGSIIPSVLIAPFLQKYDHLNVGLNRTDSSPVETSTLHIPFLMIGALDSLALVFQLFLFTFHRYHTPPMYANENFEMIDDAKNVSPPIDPELKDKNVSINQQENVTSMGVSSRKIKLVAIIVLFLGVYTGMEVSTMQFLPTFGQYSDLKMTESASSYVLTGLIGMSCIGRLIGAIIIVKVRPELLIFINFILVLAGNLILLIWSNDSLPMFWLGSMILGMGFSTIFPGFCAFMEKYLVFTTSVASSVLVFGAFVSSIYPFIIGKFIERHAVVLTYTNLFSTSAGIVVMIWGYKLTRNIVSRVR